jgi:hypothetical protein
LWQQLPDRGWSNQSRDLPAANHGDRQDEETLGRLAMAIGDENSEPHRSLDH